MEVIIQLSVVCLQGTQGRLGREQDAVRERQMHAGFPGCGGQAICLGEAWFGWHWSRICESLGPALSPLPQEGPISLLCNFFLCVTNPYIYLFTCGGYMPHLHAEVKWQPVEWVLFLPCEFRGSSSGRRA